MQWWVYIIETKKKNLYTGITTDVDRRFLEHRATSERLPGAKGKKGAKFFYLETPAKIVYRKSFPSRSEASRQEALIKKMSASDKRVLITQHAVDLLA